MPLKTYVSHAGSASTSGFFSSYIRAEKKKRRRSQFRKERSRGRTGKRVEKNTDLCGRSVRIVRRNDELSFPGDGPSEEGALERRREISAISVV